MKVADTRRMLGVHAAHVFLCRNNHNIILLIFHPETVVLRAVDCGLCGWKYF
jgi:hypothetical protein